MQKAEDREQPSCPKQNPHSLLELHHSILAQNSLIAANPAIVAMPAGRAGMHPVPMHLAFLAGPNGSGVQPGCFTDAHHAPAGSYENLPLALGDRDTLAG